MFRSRYHEILGYRVEGLKKYGGRLTSDIYGPPSCLSFPTIGLKAPAAMPAVKIGPFHAGDNPPILVALRRLLAKSRAPVRVLELGPGRGTLAAALRAEFAGRIEAYYGIETDQMDSDSYTRLSSVREITESVNLVVASEVIEHLSPDAFFGEFLTPLLPRLTPEAALVVGTPNALAPSSIFGDFTHVQAYAWYDLYALLRLFFESVDVLRTRYVWSLERLATLVPRAIFARILELDWCEEIVCISRRPRR
ncbi:MAG: methyltransferase domain-containing protein [Candidatus Tyrphobacter sp.]